MKTEVFKLNFDFPPSNTKINLHDKVYLAGSCFSDEMGTKFQQHKFQSCQNPFGTLFNPLSIFNSIAGKLDVTNTIESQGVFYHWDCHSKISGLEENELKNEVAKTMTTSTEFLESAQALILTFGTAFVYTYKPTGSVVGNCHKVPADQFEKRLLSKQEITNAFDEVYAGLDTNLNIVLTVSPVRHIRDGLIENNLSKAVLLESVHELVKNYSNVEYFPSYEIMNDELRDYRFFARDMIHPSDQAIDYIWNSFSKTYFDNETSNFIEKWSKIQLALNHNGHQPNSMKHQHFIQTTISQLEKLKDQVDVSNEIASLKTQLI